MTIAKSVIFAILIVNCFQLNSQDFKEVKSAQDVIDNFIIANGGVENLKKVKSIRATGSLSGKEKENEYYSYVSEDVYYVSFKSKEMDVFEAYDAVKNTGWISLGSMSEDLKGGLLETFKISTQTALWLYYYNKDKYGINYVKMPDDTIREIPCYVLGIQRGLDTIETDYFDTKTFDVIRQDIGKWGYNYTVDYDDFRIAASSGLRMPFKIMKKLGHFKLDTYKFNVDFDKSLLKKKN